MYLYNNNQTKSGCEIYDRVCGCERPTWNVVAGIYLGGGSRLEKVKVNPLSLSHRSKSRCLLLQFGILARGSSSIPGISPVFDNWCQYSTSPALSFRARDSAGMLGCGGVPGNDGGELADENGPELESDKGERSGDLEGEDADERGSRIMFASGPES